MIFNYIKSILRRIRNVYFIKTKKVITNFTFGQIPYILQKGRLIRELKPGFISTMTKSGTWYNRELFYFYNKLISGETSTEIIDNMISEKKKIRALIKSDYDKTGYDAFFISHWGCPGFDRYNGKYKKEWDNLIFYNSYTYPSFLGQIPNRLTQKTMEKRYNTYYNWNPEKNNDARLVYLYRNPLDQSVSYFTSIQKMKLQELRYGINNQSEKILIKDVKDYIRTVGMDNYIKHYLPYTLMKEKYPDNFLLIQYESMVREPEKTFGDIFEFLEIDITRGDNMEYFQNAIQMSHKENIIKLENAYGRSIANQFLEDQTGERQLRDGKISKWKNYFNSKDLEYINKRLNQFRLSLDDFTIE